jgi:hypothetical protein
MNINKDQFNSLFMEALKGEIITFDTDFRSIGEKSSFAHSWNMYGIFQAGIYNMDDPFLIAGKHAIMYLIASNILPILYGKISKITKIGSILKGGSNYPILKEIRNCKSCGSSLYNSICEYCGSFKENGEVIDARIGSLDVYTIPEIWSSNFEENILCLSRDLKTNRLIKLDF